MHSYYILKLKQFKQENQHFIKVEDPDKKSIMRLVPDLISFEEEKLPKFLDRLCKSFNNYQYLGEALVEILNEIEKDEEYSQESIAKFIEKILTDTKYRE